MARRGEKQADTGTTSSAATNDPAGSSSQSGGGTAVQQREQGRGRRRGLAPVLGGTGLMRGIPPSPWELMGRMSEELSQLFESIGGTGLAGTTRGQGVAAPATRARGAGEAGTGQLLLIPQIEVLQRDDAIVVRADMPGMNADEIDVTIENGMLVISGERREERREEREGFVRSEVSYGTFYRTIPLPDGADENNIAAAVRNGVLEVVVPVSQTQTARRVEVRPDEGGTSPAGGTRAGGTERGGRGDGHG
jgi:HSP20 family protein